MNDTELKLIVKHYGYWVENMIEEGWDASLLTLMFKPLRGSWAEIEAAERAALQAVYARALTRIFRRPHAACNAGQHPIWIACPDYPVPKRAKVSLREVLLNEGRHWHAIVLIPPFCRLRVPFYRLVNENPDHFTVPSLHRAHAKAINSRPGYVTGYGLKAILRGRATLDDLLVLPRSPKEVGRGSTDERRILRHSRSTLGVLRCQ